MGKHKRPKLGLRKYLRQSSCHRKLIEVSKICGCFYCLSTFTPDQITDWIDPNEPEDLTTLPQGQTALCPFCGIDSVIGDPDGTDITPALLMKMHEHSFGDLPGSKKMKDDHP